MLQLSGLVESLESIEVKTNEVKALIQEIYLNSLRVKVSAAIYMRHLDSQPQEFNSNLSKYAEMVEQTLDLNELDHHKFAAGNGRPQCVLDAGEKLAKHGPIDSSDSGQYRRRRGATSREASTTNCPNCNAPAALSTLV